MPVSIRRAVVADAPRLTANNIAMALETEALRLDADTVARGVRRVFEHDVGAHYVVAEQGGAVVGQLMITREWSDWRNADVWWIQSVYVEPKARAQGVYAALYAHVRHAARAAGAGGVRLYVDTTNTQAQAVYTKLGMTGEHYRVFEAMFED